MEDSTRTITEERVKLVDSLTKAPQYRTLDVWNILKEKLISKEISEWDIICFCGFYLLGTAQQFTYLKDTTAEITRLIRYQHYLFPENIGLKVDGLQREQEGTREDTALPESID